MAVPGFIFGGNTGINSPEELARARMLAEALRGPQAPAKTVGEGLAVLGQAIRGRREMNAVNQASTAGQASAQSAIARALGGAGDFPAAPASGGATAAGQPNYRDAIASIESKGSGDYSAIGPTNPKLGRALGRYQVMEANIGPWSKAALGKEVTPEEFLASPEIQDAIFDHQFGSYVQKYGNAEDAASAWFTGQPLSKGANRRDVLGTTGAGYVKKFAAALNGPSSAPAKAPVQVASLDPSAGMGAAPDPYGQVPARDSRGEDQRAKFRQWNSDPIANEAANEASIDPALAGVIQRAKQIAGTDFVIGSGKRDAAMQQKAVDWGWSKTNESDHLGGGAADLWPVVNGQVVFDPEKQGAIVQAMKQAAKEKGVDLEAGADWKRFKDTPHFGMIGQTPMGGPIPSQRPGNPIAQALVSPQQPAPAQQAIAAALQPPQPGTPAASTPAGRRVVQQMVNPASITGGAPMPFMEVPQAAVSPSSAPSPQQVAQAAPDSLPVMAGGSADAIPKGQLPSIQQLVEAAQNPWLNDGQRAMVNMLLKQQMDAQDPSTQLGLEKQRLELDALKNPKPKYDFMAGKDGSIFRANETEGSIDQVYGGKPDTFRTLTAEEKAKMGLPADGAYQIGADNKISQIGGGGTTVNIDQKTEGAFEKKLAEKQAETFDAMSTEGMNAKAELGVIGELDNLLQGQGGTLTGIAGLAAKYGIGGEGMGDLQATQAIINKLIPSQRQPGSGTMSDRDVDMFTRSLPSLWNQPGGNQKILNVMRGLATYKQAQGEIADQILAGEISRQEGRKMLRELPNPLAEFTNPPSAPDANKKRLKFNPATGELE